MTICDEICLSYLLPVRFELHLIQTSTKNYLAYALRNLDELITVSLNHLYSTSI